MAAATKTTPVLTKLSETTAVVTSSNVWLEKISDYATPINLVLASLALAISIVSLFQTGSTFRVQKKALRAKLKIYLRDVKGTVSEMEFAEKELFGDKPPKAVSILYASLLLENFPITADDLVVLGDISKDEDREKSLLFLKSQIQVWYSQKPVFIGQTPYIQYPATTEGQIVFKDHLLRISALEKNLSTALKRLGKFKWEWFQRQSQSK